MTDQNTANEVRAEGLREDFYQAVQNADWDEARAALADMEVMKIDTYKLRREMNDAMAEEINDFDAVKVEVDASGIREAYREADLSSQAESYGGSY